MTVEYPSGAQGSPRVVVFLLVNARGEVVSAHAPDAEQPFRACVEEAAREWTFDPATSDGTPVSAKIKVLVPFDQPRPPAPAPPAPTDSAGPVSPAAQGAAPLARTDPPAKAPAPIDVTIQGTQAPAMRLEVSRAEARLIPGTFGDPLRAVEALPGVTPVVSGAPYFFVRGAPPGQVGNFLDGIRLPQLYHVAMGPSVLPPALISRVQLYPGGYPARYGRFVGGIVEARTAERSQRATGEASARLTDVGGHVEVPFADGRGSVLGGGRYAYAGAILSVFAPDMELNYWDYLGRVAFAVSDRDTISALAFGAHDYLGTRSDKATLADTTFHRMDVRWERAYEHGTIRQAITLGQDTSRGDVVALYEQSTEEAPIVTAFGSKSIAGRTEVIHSLPRGQEVQFGMDIVVENFEARHEAGAPLVQDNEVLAVMTSLFPERTDYAAGLWLEATWKPAVGLEVSPGVRVDGYQSMEASALSADARLASRFEVTGDVDLIHAFGTAHQAPSFVGPVPGVQIGALRGGLQKSLQHAAGAEADLGEGLRLRGTVFQNVYFNMSDVLGIRNQETEGLGPRSEARALGSSRGVEIYLHRSLTRRVGGFLAYTLSRSTRSVERRRVPSAYDRTHVAQGALSVNLGRGWRCGSRVVFYTGIPTQPSATDLAMPDRTDPFFRVDARAERRWVLGETSWLSLVFEGQNITLSKEVIGYECGATACTAKTIGPMTLPNLAIEVGF